MKVNPTALSPFGPYSPELHHQNMSSGYHFPLILLVHYSKVQSKVQFKLQSCRLQVIAFSLPGHTTRHNACISGSLCCLPCVRLDQTFINVTSFWQFLEMTSLSLRHSVHRSAWVYICVMYLFVGNQIPLTGKL